MITVSELSDRCYFAELYFLNIRPIKSVSNNCSDSKVTEFCRSIRKRNAASTSAWALGENFSSETAWIRKLHLHWEGKRNPSSSQAKQLCKSYLYCNSSWVAQRLFGSFPILTLWWGNTGHSRSALACEGNGLSPPGKADERIK